MNTLLTDDEVRVLGCLMEKEMATPDYYPLTLNALINACNQKSNRSPVVNYDEETVLYALNGLQENKVVRKSSVSRVAKYEQIFSNELKLLQREKAVICILMLRGPQTLGEIRGRTDRLYSFNSLEEVQDALATLEEINLVQKLAKQPGRKESRYGHLLSGEPQETLDKTISQRDSDTVIVRKEHDRPNDLQLQIDSLRKELEELKFEFSQFKSQFD